MVMKRKSALGALVLTLTFVVLGWICSAAETPKGQPPIFKVPTTGTIIDVIYVPEFDDWWVKCREGESVAVYSYDRQRKKWGKVVFVPDKAKAAAMKREMTETEKPSKPALETKPPVPAEGMKTPSVPEKKKELAPVPQKSSQPKEKKQFKHKWWDPLGIIKTK